MAPPIRRLLSRFHLSLWRACGYSVSRHPATFSRSWQPPVTSLASPRILTHRPPMLNPILIPTPCQTIDMANLYTALTHTYFNWENLRQA
ncbi:hypothetical protein RSAG8_11652, partial [Rhizoctonia solani AG-8 WAC10335]